MREKSRRVIGGGGEQDQEKCHGGSCILSFLFNLRHKLFFSPNSGAACHNSSVSGAEGQIQPGLHCQLRHVPHQLTRIDVALK